MFGRVDVSQLCHGCQWFYRVARFIDGAPLKLKLGRTSLPVHLIILKLQLGTRQDGSNLSLFCEPAVTSVGKSDAV